MKIGITGSGGFLGGHVSSFLNDTGNHTAVDLDPWTRGRTTAPFAPGLDWVLHFGAKTSIAGSFAAPDAFIEENVRSTEVALRIAQENDARFLLMSSYVYGAPTLLPISEQHPVSDANPYMKSKLRCEEACERWSNDVGRSVTVLRGFHIYGAKMPSGRLIGDLLRLSRSGERLVINDAEPRRDYLYVGDFIELLSRVLESGSDQAAGVFNVGAGTSHSNLEVAETLRELIGDARDVHSLGLRREGDVMDVRADITKVCETFSWEPTTSLQQGLRRAMDASA